MKQQIDRILDYIIALHRIEDKKIPSDGQGKAVGLGIFLWKQNAQYNKGGAWAKITNFAERD